MANPRRWRRYLAAPGPEGRRNHLRRIISPRAVSTASSARLDGLRSHFRISIALAGLSQFDVSTFWHRRTSPVSRLRTRHSGDNLGRHAAAGEAIDGRQLDAVYSRKPNRIPVPASNDRVAETEIQTHQFKRFLRMRLVRPLARRSRLVGRHQPNII